jgi:bifunctional polynucleotide phosphatase/kinase
MSKSGTLHGKDVTDWRWWNESVPAKLRALALKKYTIIISSNQGRLTEFDGSEAPEAAPFKRKMEFIMRDLQIPVTLFVACANDIYRKPRPGLWSIIPKLTGNEGCGIDKAQSLVVGDAAGRESDFSDSDVHWAMNAGVPFYTPEVFFLGETPKPLGHRFHPEWHLNGNEEGKDGGKYS